MVIKASKTKLLNFDLRGFSFDLDLQFHVDNVCYVANEIFICVKIERVNENKSAGLVSP